MSAPSPPAAVITGAAHGLGRALAFALAKRGFALALIDTDATALAQVHEQLRTTTSCTTHAADVADQAAVQQAHADILAAHGRVDWLINNAAVSMTVPFAASSTADMQRLMAVNYWGTVHACRQFLPDLHRRTDAHLVHIISGFALLGFPNKTAYAASKAAVMGFTQALRTELHGSHVRTSLVLPPAMGTDILRSGPHLGEAGLTAEQRFLQRHGMAVDRVAERIVRCASKGRPRIVIGRSTWWLDRAARLFPSAVHTAIGRRKGRNGFW